MSWEAFKRETVSPKDIYDLTQAHKLMPKNVEAAIHLYRNMAQSVEWWDILDSENKVADCLVTLSPFGIAQLDLVPIPEFFAPSSDYLAKFQGAMATIISGTFMGHQEIRKIESEVPVSRGRTKKALIAIGFKFEGKRAIGVQFYGKDPEDTFLLGMVPEAQRSE